MAAPVKTCSSALMLCSSVCSYRSICSSVCSYRSICSSVCSYRSIGTGRAAQAGAKWRKQHGLALNGSRYGLLTDLPDWSFADGRPAPPMKGQQRRRRESEELSRRIVTLSTEMDGGMEACARRREEAERTEEHRRSLRLTPKGRKSAAEEV